MMSFTEGEGGGFRMMAASLLGMYDIGFLPTSDMLIFFNSFWPKQMVLKQVCSMPVTILHGGHHFAVALDCRTRDSGFRSKGWTR